MISTGEEGKAGRMPHTLPAFLFFLCVSLFLSACSSTPRTPHGKPLMKDGRYASSYEAFVADPQYRFTRDIWYHDERIQQARTRNSRIVIHLNDQRGVLWYVMKLYLGKSAIKKQAAAPAKVSKKAKN